MCQFTEIRAIKTADIVKDSMTKIQHICVYRDLVDFDTNRTFTDRNITINFTTPPPSNISSKKYIQAVFSTLLYHL